MTRSRSSASLVGLLTLGVLVASGSPVGAQPSPQDAKVKEARDRYQKGQAAYDLGQYDEAISEWEQSYKLSQKPLLLFNLGQAARLKGDCERSLTYYKAYLRAAPEADNSAEAEGFIAEMDKCMRARTPVARPVPEPETAPEPGAPVEDTPSRAVEATSSADSAPRPARTKKWVGISMMGGGAALVATGIIFGAKASSAADDVTSACADTGGCEWSDLSSTESSGQRAETLQWVFYGTGAAAAIGGAALYYFGTRERTPSTLVTVAPAPAGATLTVSGRW